MKIGEGKEVKLIEDNSKSSLSNKGSDMGGKPPAVIIPQPVYPSHGPKMLSFK